MKRPASSVGKKPAVKKVKKPASRTDSGWRSGTGSTGALEKLIDWAGGLAQEVARQWPIQVFLHRSAIRQEYHVKWVW